MMKKKILESKFYHFFSLLILKTRTRRHFGDDPSKGDRLRSMEAAAGIREYPKRLSGRGLAEHYKGA